MIICKRPARLDDHLQKATTTTPTTTIGLKGGGLTRVTGVTRGDGTEGGEEGNAEGGEEGKLLRTGQDGTTSKAL